MMGVSIKQLWVLSIMVVSLGAACGQSKTVDQINAFVDKVCACPDAACAKALEAEYMEWWGNNQRARGSEGDRKDVEKAMERYAGCHANLVGPEPEEAPIAVPKVDLTPPAPKALDMDVAESEVPAPVTPPKSTEAPSEASKNDPATP